MAYTLVEEEEEEEEGRNINGVDKFLSEDCNIHSKLHELAYFPFSEKI
jgi:hypothetical protein